MQTLQRPSPVTFILRYKYVLLAIIIHLIVALIRCAYVSYGPLCLQGDEAQYWTWTQHLDWSYYSKPPLIAFCNYASQWLFGHSVLAVRINAIFCGMLTGWLTFLFTFSLYKSARKAFWASMLVFAMPFYFEVSLFYSTDSILLLCWLIASFSYWKASETNRWTYWIILGVAIGAGALGKYAMLFFIPATLIYMALKNRKQLSNPRFYVAIIISIIIFSPVIIWNINHQFIGYKHIENLSGLGSEYHWKLQNLINFFLGQVLLMSPLFMVMYYKLYKHYRRQKITSFFVIPMVCIWIVFFFISIIKKREANINWTMFVYIGLPIMLASYIIDYHKERLAAYLCGITMVLLTSLTTIPMWKNDFSKRILPIKIDPVRKLSMWDEAAGVVDSVYRYCDKRRTFIFTDDYMLTSELLFYMYPDTNIFFYNNGTRLCQFQLWKGMEQYNNLGYDALYVECNSIINKSKQSADSIDSNIAAAFSPCRTHISRICFYRDFPAYRVDIYKLHDYKSLKPMPFTHY
jgi:hypothetical protein